MVCPCICVIRDQWISSPGRDDVRRRDHGVEPRYMDHRNRRSRSLPADREGFDVPIHILRVTEDAPLSGAVAAANPSILANRLEKIRCLVRSNFMFDGDQDWPKISIYCGGAFSIAGSRQWFQEVRSTVASGSRKNNARVV